jgi:hypothetical protein
LIMASAAFNHIASRSAIILAIICSQRYHGLIRSMRVR